MSDLTVRILEQLRAEVARLDAKVETKFDATNQHLDALDQRTMVLEHILRDVHAQVILLGRLARKHDVAIEDLRKRVTKLEKKGGS